MPDMTYTLFNVSGAGVAGAMALTPEHKAQGIPPNWTGYVCVDDCDAAAAKAKSLGGSVMREPFDIPGVGRIAIIADPHGAVIAIMKPVPPSSSRRSAWSAAITSVSVPSRCRRGRRPPRRPSSARGAPPVIRACWSYSASTVVSPTRSRRLAACSQAARNRRPRRAGHIRARRRAGHAAAVLHRLQLLGITRQDHLGAACSAAWLTTLANGLETMDASSIRTRLPGRSRMAAGRRWPGRWPRNWALL